MQHNANYFFSTLLWSYIHIILRTCLNFSFSSKLRYHKSFENLPLEIVGCASKNISTLYCIHIYEWHRTCKITLLLRHSTAKLGLTPRRPEWDSGSLESNNRRSVLSLYAEFRSVKTSTFHLCAVIVSIAHRTKTL